MDDAAGNRLQAHGAGIFSVGSTYYMVGEGKSAGSTFTAVACYSSTGLVHWTWHTDVLCRQGSGDPAAGRIVERPRVLYNGSAGRYVMWMHIDNTSYSERRGGVVTSTTPCGPYTYHGASDPLGHQRRDLGLFKDDDGTAYLSAVASFPEIEALAMVKVGDRCFLLGSHLTGWALNDNVYAAATSSSGPWSGFTNVAVAGTRTDDSRSSFLLPVTGTGGADQKWNRGLPRFRPVDPDTA